MEKTKSFYKLLNLWLPVIFWASAIFLFSSFPTVSTSQIHWKDFVLKKTAHIVEYGILTILSYRALIGGGIDKKKAGIFAVLITIIYGLSDEFHQSFTPGREPRFRDVMFDFTGGIIAIYSVWSILPKAPKKLQTYFEKFHIY